MLWFANNDYNKHCCHLWERDVHLVANLEVDLNRKVSDSVERLSKTCNRKAEKQWLCVVDLTYKTAEAHKSVCWFGMGCV